MVEIKGRFSKSNVEAMLWEYHETIQKKYPHFFGSGNTLRGTAVLGSKRFDSQDEATAYGEALAIDSILDIINY